MQTLNFLSIKAPANKQTQKSSSNNQKSASRSFINHLPHRFISPPAFSPEMNSPNFHPKNMSPSNIAERLSRENKKLRKNVSELHFIGGDPETPSAKLSRASNLYHDKLHKYQKKIKDKDNELRKILSVFNEFQIWWKEQIGMNPTQIQGQIQSPERQKNEKNYENKLDHLFSNIKLKVQEQENSRKKNESIMIRNQILESQIGSFFQILGMKNNQAMGIPCFQILSTIELPHQLNLTEIIVQVISMKAENQLLKRNTENLQKDLKNMQNNLKEKGRNGRPSGQLRNSDVIKVLQQEKENLSKQLKITRKQKEYEAQFYIKKSTEYENKIRNLITELEQFAEKTSSFKFPINEFRPISESAERNGEKSSEQLKLKVVCLQNEIKSFSRQNEEKAKQIQNLISLVNDCQDIIEKKDKNIDQLSQQVSKLSEQKQNFEQIAKKLFRQIQEEKIKQYTHLPTKNDMIQNQLNDYETSIQIASNRNESAGQIPVYLEKSDFDQSAFLEEVKNKINFPSNCKQINFKEDVSAENLEAKLGKHPKSERKLTALQEGFRKVRRQITSMTEQISQIQDQIEVYDPLLRQIFNIKQLLPKVQDIFKQLEKHFLESEDFEEEYQEEMNKIFNDILEKATSEMISIQKVQMKINQMEQTIKSHQKQKKKATERSNKDHLELMLRKQVKNLKETNQSLTQYLKEALVRIKGEENLSFVEAININYKFFDSLDFYPIEENKQTQTEKNYYFEQLFQQIRKEGMSQQETLKIKKLMKEIEYRELVEKQQFLEAKDCFLNLYFENSSLIEKIKRVLKDKFSYQDLYELFDEDTDHGTIIENIKEVMQNQSEIGLSADRGNEIVESLRGKYFPYPSYLCDIVESFMKRVWEIKTEVDLSREAENTLGQLQHFEKKMNESVKKKDNVFKYHAGVINKICQRSKLKEEEQIRKSMIVSHGFHRF